MAHRLIAEGVLLYGGAILDDGGKMAGTTLAFDFSSRAELDAWLKVEPYVSGKVWQRIEVRRFKPGTPFARPSAT